VKQFELDNIEEALNHLKVLNSHLERGDLSDTLVLDAVNMRLIAAIEARSRLPDELRQQLFGEEWHAIRSTRNRIAHSYLQMRLDIIAATVERDIPPLIATLTSVIQGEER